MEFDRDEEYLIAISCTADAERSFQRCNKNCAPPFVILIPKLGDIKLAHLGLVWTFSESYLTSCGCSACINVAFIPGLETPS